MSEEGKEQIAEARPSFAELAKGNERLQSEAQDVAVRFVRVLGSLKNTGVITEDRDIPLDSRCVLMGKEAGYIKFKTPGGDVHVSNLAYGNLRHVLIEVPSEGAMTAEGPLILQMSIDHRFFKNALAELGTHKDLEREFRKKLLVLQLGMVQPDRAGIDRGEKFWANPKKAGDAGDFPNSVSLGREAEGMEGDEPYAVRVRCSGGKDLLETFKRTVGRLEMATSREVVREKVGEKA